MHKFKQDFIDTVQRRIRLVIDPDISLHFVDNNVTFSTPDPLDPDTVEYIKEIIAAELNEYYKKLSEDPEIQLAVEREIQRKNMEYVLAKQEELCIIRNQQYEQERLDRIERENKRIYEQQLKREKDLQHARKICAPFDELVENTLGQWELKSTSPVDDYIMINLYCRMNGVATNYCFQKFYDAKNSWNNRKRFVINKTMDMAIENNFYGLLEEAGQVLLNGKSRRAFHLNNKTKIFGKYIYRGGWGKAQFFISRQDIFKGNMRKRGNKIHVDPDLFSQFYMRYKAIQKLKSNILFMNSVKNYLDYLWRPFGIMANKGWEECKEIQADFMETQRV